MKIKTLLLMGGMLLTLTACSQSTLSAEEAVDTSKDVAVAEEVTKTDDAAGNDSWETDEGNDVAGEELEQVGDSDAKPVQTDSSTKPSLLKPVAVSFEGNEYEKYLYSTAYGSDTDTLLSRATVFGFNEPEGYDSEQELGFASFGDDSEYPSKYAAINPEDNSYLYLFTLHYADDIRAYLKNGTLFSTTDTEYPMVLSDDTIIQMETMDTIDTDYGSCDIFFMELESDLAEDDFWDLDNPIYIEAAYFSVMAPDESSDGSPLNSNGKHDIVVIYMYPNGNPDTTYEGH